MNEFPDDFNAKVLLERHYYNYDYEKEAEAKLNEIRPIIMKLAYKARNKGEKAFHISDELIKTLDIDRTRKLAYELAIRFPKVMFRNGNNNKGEIETLKIDRSENKVTNLDIISPAIYFWVYFENNE